MDDSEWSWPAWKFGMKRGDLFTKLHDQYNTQSTPIQDNEAFHHDVYEISTHASSKDEFHVMMAERREQRLEELNSGLELASVKIIANPDLIGTHQWQYAIQLFRAGSLDALVRYFSSYLPESDFDSDAETVSDHSTVSRSTGTSISNASTASTEHHDDFEDHDDDLEQTTTDATTTFFPEKGTTHEPLTIKTSIPKHSPPSPPASEAGPDTPADDAESHHEFTMHRAPTPSSRTMSFSGSESNRPFATHEAHPIYTDETSVVSTPPNLDDVDCMNEADDTDEMNSHSTPCDPAEIAHHSPQCHDDTPSPSTESYTDGVESDTATPRPRIADATFYIAAKLSAHIRRSPSPSTRTRPAHSETRRSPRVSRRSSPAQVSRTPYELLSRIQKPLSDQMRVRPQCRPRRVEVG